MAVHGDVIVVGAYAANTVIPESGSAFSFRKNVTGNDTTWTEKGSHVNSCVFVDIYHVVMCVFRFHCS